MRYNLHPLRNLAVGQDPSVLTSGGLSVTGSAVVSLATVKNWVLNPHGRGSTTKWSVFGGTSMTLAHVDDDGDGDSECIQATRTAAGHTDLSVIAAAGQFGGEENGYAPCKPGDKILVGVSGKPVSCEGDWVNMHAVAYFRDANGNSPGTPPPTSDPVAVVEGEWARAWFVVTAPANAATVCAIARFAHTASSNTVVRVDRAFVAVGYGIDFSPEDDYFDGASDGASWSGTPNASASKMPVPAWNPLLNGGAGGFDPELQAVRVYRSASMTNPSMHRLTVTGVTPGDPLYFLTHLWTDDPGSVGKSGRVWFDWLGAGDAWIASANSPDVSLSDAPQAALAGGVAPAGTAKAVIYVGAGQHSTERNVIYAATQLAPHSIDKYRDEHTRGWRLRDEEDYAAGAESIPTPNFQKRVLEIAAPTRKLEIAAPTRTLEVALGGPHA